MADFVIFPKINQIDWWNFSKLEKCIRKGEEIAEEEIEKLKNCLNKKKN